MAQAAGAATAGAAAATAAAAATRADEALHILHACNTKNCFQKWAVVGNKDAEKLTVTISPEARLSIDSLSALVRAFPVRLRGPFLTTQALTMEFLHEHEPPAPSALPSPFLSRKRARDAEPLETPVDYSAHLRDMIETCLKQYNSSTVSVSKHHCGTDDRGPWHTFDIVFSERLNLAFLLALYTHESTGYIKDLCIVNAETPHVFIRPFSDSERRIVHEWETVPRYGSAGTFTLFRHRAASRGTLRGDPV